MAIFEAGADKRGKQWMRRERLGFEFGMELAANEPRMVGHFDDFDVDAVGGAAGDAETGARQSFFVLAIEFVAMAVALGNFELCRRLCAAKEPGSSLQGQAPRRMVPPISSTPRSSRSL